MLECGIDFPRICDYLCDLGHKDIVTIGCSLGLDYRKLSDLTVDKLPLHEMVHWWLEKRDNTMSISGTPTLNSLIKALKVNGFNGHVQNIEASLPAESKFWQMN